MTPRGRDARRGGARRTLLAGIGALGLALAGAVGAAAPASAHNVVVGSTPEAGSTVTQVPDTVDITFDDVVLNLSADGSSTVVSVTDPAGAERATGCPTTQDRTVSVPVSLGPAGTYTVDWRIVSADGHPTSGKFSFTYDPPAGSSPADPTSPASPAAGSEACGASAAQPDGQDAGAGADEGGASDLVVVLGIAGGVVVLAGAAVLVALRVARRRG
ncbi:copper resistance CopC family protein [Isoptericola sp. NPDC055881]